jgi:dihydroorotase
VPRRFCLFVDRVLRGRIPVGNRFVRAEIGIEGGRIAKIGRRIDADVVDDVGNRLILPAATDLHVHFRDPGATEKEDFASGTESASHGGVTTVVDMPNTDPPTVTRTAFRAKRANAARKARIDFGLYGAVTDRQNARALLRDATALKGYMGSSTGGLLVTDEAPLLEALRASAEAGKFVAFHAESEDCLRTAQAAIRGRADGAVWSESRPDSCEADAIETLRRVSSQVRIARRMGARRRPRIHIAHLSSARGLAAVRGSGFTSEVTPHHLFASVEDLARDPRWKMNPPLRTKRDQAALWAALRAGRIDCLASDHAPHLPAEKDRGIWEAPAGVPGAETMVPLLLAAWRAGRLPLARLLKVACENPARMLRIRKGKIGRGLDADLMVVDPRAVAPIRAARLHSRCGWTPFEGYPAIFPERVYLRGTVIAENGETRGRAGDGRFVTGS